MKKIILVLILIFTSTSNVLSQKQKLKFPIWTTSKNTDIIGMSLGLYPSDWTSNKHMTRTFGVRIEPFILSPLYFLAPKVPTKNPVTQKIYGINISTGTFEKISTHGVSITGFMNNINISNGISLAGLSNTIDKANGIVIAFGGNGVEKANGIFIGGPWGNYAEQLNGIQIGFLNKTSSKSFGLQIGLENVANKLKGIQIGLWNKNEKRSLPFINWDF